MPYAKQFLRMSFLFTVAATEEVAVTSLEITTLGTAAFDAAAVLALWTTGDLDAAAAAYAALFASGGNLYWADYSNLTGVKLAAVGVDGKYVTGARLEAETAYQGTRSDVPAQNTLCMSFTSGLTFAKGNYGRMYLPHSSADMVAATPYLGVGTAGAIASRGATFVRAVNTLANARAAGSGVVILGSTGTGTVKGVANVRGSRVIDTQRRRTNRLNPDYQVVAV